MLELLNEFAMYVNITWKRDAAVKVHCSRRQVLAAVFYPILLILISLAMTSWTHARRNPLISTFYRIMRIHPLEFSHIQCR